VLLIRTVPEHPIYFTFVAHGLWWTIREDGEDEVNTGWCHLSPLAQN